MNTDKNDQLSSQELQRQLRECKSAYSQRTEQFTRLLGQAKELTANLRENFEGIIHLLNDVVLQTSPALGGHAKRTATLSRSIAYKLHLNPDRRRLVFYAASLHDLSLAGKESEWRRGEGSDWRSHPVRSAEMIGTVRNLKRIAATVRAHHECFNGEGFPDGLSGDTIPLESRIIAAAVTCDRLTALHRTPVDEAVATMRAEGHFDPAVLDSLKEILQNEAYRKRRGDRLLGLHELSSGMLLADDLLLESGLVLYPRNTILDEETLERIKQFAPMLPHDHLFRIFPSR